MTGAISIATGKASTTYLKKAPVFRGFSVAINDSLVMEGCANSCPYSCNAVVLQLWEPSSFHTLPSAKLT
jgi:hypothetical protein